MLQSAAYKTRLRRGKDSLGERLNKLGRKRIRWGEAKKYRQNG